MRTAGKLLIYGAVSLRAVVVLSSLPEFTMIVVLLITYGLLLFSELLLISRKNPHLIQSPRLQLVYLLLQCALVLALLIISNYEDFLAELFIPLSLDSVSFFGRKYGFQFITFFSLLMTGALLFSSEGVLFGLAMGILYSGICFLFGGYAYQVQKAEAARIQNHQTLHGLQAAHCQLQEYAEHVAELTIERERSRLARELHDSVTQTVFSMNLAAQSASLLIEKDSVRVMEQLSRIGELAASAQCEIQSLVSQLDPVAIVEMDLPIALQRLAADQKTRNGLKVSVEVHGDTKFSETIVANLYSIAQEALTNIAKHSGVCEAAVSLFAEKGRRRLEIEDHGQGFDPGTMLDEPDHFGLTGMSERAREIGWSLSVESQRGQGTLIRVIEPRPGDSE